MFQHFAATTPAGHFLAYSGPRGPVAIMECATEEVAQREADRRNELARGAAMAASLRRQVERARRHVRTPRPLERMYGPEFGDFAD